MKEEEGSGCGRSVLRTVDDSDGDIKPYLIG